MMNCPKCGCAAWRSQKHDAQYCPWCIKWNEPTCYDQECKFCQDRPTYPYPDVKDAQLD